MLYRKNLLTLAIASGFAALPAAYAGDSDDWRNPQRDVRGGWGDSRGNGGC